MGEKTNLSQKEVQKIAKSFPLKPRFNSVYITLNKVVSDDTLELEDNIMDEVQYIVAKGDRVTDLEVGDKVIVNLAQMTRMAEISTEQGYQKVPQIQIDPVQVDGQIYAFLDDRYIKAIDNR
jgi:hypothetical protein